MVERDLEKNKRQREEGAERFRENRRVYKKKKEIQ